MTTQIIYQSLTFEELTAQQQACVESSMKATMRSYSPYSNFKVGAAALLSNGKIIVASNQENVSFSAGVCAERALIYSNECSGQTLEIIAISANKDGEFVDVSPCGVCRQSILELEVRQKRDIMVIFKHNDRFLLMPNVKSLLPFSFTDF